MRQKHLFRTGQRRLFMNNKSRYPKVQYSRARCAQVKSESDEAQLMTIKIIPSLSSQSNRAVSLVMEDRLTLDTVILRHFGLFFI